MSGNNKSQSDIVIKLKIPHCVGDEREADGFRTHDPQNHNLML